MSRGVYNKSELKRRLFRNIAGKEDDIAPPIKHCRKDADRDKKYQGTKAQTGWRPSSFCNAEIFYLCQVFLARFSWGSNNMQT